MTVEQNFDSLLVPKDHVSRSRNDNYYVTISSNFFTFTQMTSQPNIKILGELKDDAESSHISPSGMHKPFQHQLTIDMKYQHVCCQYISYVSRDYGRLLMVIIVSSLSVCIETAKQNMGQLLIVFICGDY